MRPIGRAPSARPRRPGLLERAPKKPARTGLRAFTIDFGPLRRRRDFRLLFFGQATTFFGSMITYVAIPFQAYR